MTGGSIVSMFAACTLTALLAAPMPAEDPGLTVGRLYHGIEQPIMLDVRAPESFETASLVLLDADGTVLLMPAPVRPGRVDLAEAMPDIWRLRRASFLQLLIDDEPLGTPLVVEPLLSRMIPLTEEAINPNGIRYTRIVGWHDEHHPPMPGSEAGGDDGTSGAVIMPSPSHDDPISRAIAPRERTDDRLISGLRIYTERDVIMHTTLGDIHLTMRPDAAPNTAWNFLTLCSGGFYDGVIFHRVVALTADGDPFVIQGGDPTGAGSGGPGYWLPLEPSDLQHDFGVISMARDVPPDSAGSQFFICLSREGTARLDGNYCSFGYAVEGAETILAIAGVQIEIGGNSPDRPVDPPVILATELVASPPRAPARGRPDTRVSIPEPEEPKKPERVGRE